MARAEDASKPRRIGVTGHRPNRLGWWARLRLPGRIDAVLERIEAEADGADFVMYSGLAEGADTIAARRALRRGWSLIGVLPFAPDVYEQGFPAGRARRDFRRLLAACSDLRVLGGSTPVDDPYRASGQILLAETDLLIAIHDGGRSAGAGGTHDLMAIAAEAGLRIVEIRV